MDKEQKIPGPDHPISIEPVASRIRVQSGGKVVADTTSALALREANYPVVYYIPRNDADQSLLKSTETNSYCPYKGDCSYFTITSPEGDIEDSVWSYEHPFEAVSSIAEHLAFYPNKVEVTVDDVN